MRAIYPTPQKSFGEGDEPHMGDPDAGRLTPTGEESVEGEELPDFSSIEGPEGDPEPTPAPEKVKPEPKKPTQNDPSPSLKTKKDQPKDEEPAPTPEPKKAEEPKVEPEPKREEPAPAPEPEKKGIPADDKDLDEIQPKPGSSPKIVNDFEKLRNATKEARRVAREHEARAVQAEAKAAAVKPQDPAVENELNQLREYYRVHEGQNDPRFKKQFEERETSAVENLFATLKSVGLDDEAEKKMREIGLDKYGSAWWDKNILSKLGPMNQGRVLAALQGYQKVGEERTQAIEQLAKDATAFESKQKEQQEGWWRGWSEKVETGLMGAAKGQDWAFPKEIPANASESVKAEIEAHNKAVSEREVEVTEMVQKIARLDPDTISKVIYDAANGRRLAGEIKKTTAQLESANARVKELEDELAATSSASRQGRQSSAPSDKSKHKPTEITPGMTADEAFEVAGL